MRAQLRWLRHLLAWQSWLVAQAAGLCAACQQIVCNPPHEPCLSDKYPKGMVRGHDIAPFLSTRGRDHTSCQGMNLRLRP